VALVAGATRGAGRAIVVELARAGLFVYATGRSSRVTGRSEMDRPETIEETADLIRDAGGSGAALAVDHEDPAAVTELVTTIARAHGRLDVLVNDIFGGDRYAEWDKPLWEANAPFRRNVGFYYDLVKANVERIVIGLTAELEDLPVTAVGVTAGWLRSEKMLENFGVTESNWREACVKRPGFAISESASYVARGVAALAQDAAVSRWEGTIISARQLADVYGFTDTDGSKPDCWGYLAAYGWERRRNTPQSSGSWSRSARSAAACSAVMPFAR
jgi:short chain dehydrogenase